MNEERCVCCGAVIPEGRQVCPRCEEGSKRNSDRPPVEPIIAEDFDGPPGFYYEVCPGCRCGAVHGVSPCPICGQRLIWEEEK